MRTISLAMAACFLAWLVPPPAEAADKVVYVYTPGMPSPAWAGRGAYDDSADRVCAHLGRNDLHDKVVVRIRPRDGLGPTLRVVDTTHQDGRQVCRSAAGVPDGVRYRMRVTVRDFDGDVFRVASNFRT